MKFIREIYGHYKSYHIHGPLMLTYAGIVGVFALPVFYLIRIAKGGETYDDLPVRGTAVLLCLLLLLKKHWPEKLQPYYIAFSYPVLILSLPLLFVFTSLMNGGGPAAVANTMMATFFVILMTDWRNSIVMLTTGMVGGTLLYLMVHPDPTVPMDYVGRLPLLIVVVVGGILFKAAGNRAAVETMRQAYAALAGSIAHEMRNPLSQIRHSLEGMQQALPAPSTTEPSQSLLASEIDTLYRHLAESEVAVMRGLQVIAMTLDEVSAKPMDAEAFQYLSAAEATKRAVQEYAFQSEIDRAKVSVQVEKDFTFRGDETAYLFVLFNLIKNALYYLALHPQARIFISVGDQQVRVRDTGPGIAPEVLAGLFQPFRSVGKAGGTGLGLAYCRRVMKAFGGDISCQSTLGEYTQFTLSFPPVSEAEYESHRRAELESARAAFAGKRILIVDDDASQRKTTCLKLQPLDVELHEAADGLLALEALASQRFDLVVLDLNMPLLDGYGVAERLRQGLVAPLNREVRIVAYSSEPAQVASVKTQKAGMDAFISKPCDGLPLVQALRRALLAPARARGQASLTGRRIILADDNPYNRKSVAAYLRHAGAVVSEAGHGGEVIQQLRSPGHWDAVVMDLNMPGMSGLEAAKAIRGSTAPWRGVPILALTAHSGEEIAAQAKQAGMDDFVTKPVEAGVLFTKLGRLILGEGAATDAASAPAQPESVDGTALDLQRLDSYRSIGMLEELLADYLPELVRRVDKLEKAVAVQDFQTSLDALHSLLGMSGEAGAQGLYKLTRAIYVPMLESKTWPQGQEWVGQIRAAAEQAEQALKAYATGQTTPTISEK